jgi:hypothetical protein
MSLKEPGQKLWEPEHIDCLFIGEQALSRFEKAVPCSFL